MSGEGRQGSPSASEPSEVFIYVALLLSAASSLMYEVIATNILFFYFVESSYSIATVLSVFLFGLGLGSLGFHALRHKIGDKKSFFVSLQLLLAVYAVGIFSNLTQFLSSIHTSGLFLTSGVVLLLPTIILGMIFPLSADLLHRRAESNVGLVYAVDLLGAVMGSLVAGFVIIPLIGNRASIFVVSIVNIVAAAVLLRRSHARFRFHLAAGAVLLPAATLFMVFALRSPPQERAAPPGRDRSGAAVGAQDGPKTFTSYDQISAYAYKNKRDRQFGDFLAEMLQPSFEKYAVFRKQSPFGEIVVFDSTLFIDRRDQCSLHPHKDTSEREIVQYSLAPFAADSVEVLNVGLGCGGTLKEVVKGTRKPVDVVEINSVVAEANVHFGNIAAHERVNLIISDGLQYLKGVNKKYHAIILDIENPAVVHSSNLYTVEAVELVHGALADNGVFGLWYNDCRAPGYLDTIYYTLRRSFEFVYRPMNKVFIASKQELPDLKAYRPRSKSGETAVNTLDRKVLSKMYFENCAWGAGSTFLKD